MATGRDAWVYNFSTKALRANMDSMVNFYNAQVNSFRRTKTEDPTIQLDSFLSTDSSRISWTVNLKKDAASNVVYSFDDLLCEVTAYRPFCKQNYYSHKPFIERSGISKDLKPTKKQENIILGVSSAGTNKGLGIIVTDLYVDYHLAGDTQCLPLYYYQENQKNSLTLFDEGGESEFNRYDGITDFILERAKNQYGKIVIKEDIFYYVYGFLHNPQYREIFANDLKKGLPKLPLIDDVNDFWAYSKAGRKLAALHINYESVPPFSGVDILGAESGFFSVEKMRFPKKNQKDTIIFNGRITISNIPTKAYEYVVNGKSAIEWIMERYQVTINKDSGIKNDPNDWAKEVGNPKYILDLLLSVINVSVQTVDIVNTLPKVTFK